MSLAHRPREQEKPMTARGNHRLPIRRKLKLALSIIGLCGLWLVVLPWIARQPRMAAHLQWLEDQGIDAGAMYYTELEAMKPILEKLERRR